MALVPVYYKSMIVADAIIDNDDLDLVGSHTWRLDECGNANKLSRYAKATINGKHMYMHRLILGLQSGDARVTDHINRNGLDCRRSNLRICTRVENQHNRAVFSCNKTGLKNITYHGGRYTVNLMVVGVKVHRSYHKSLDEAIAARAVAVMTHGIPAYTI